MPEYTLDQVKQYRPPTKLHPIADRIYKLYDSGGFKLSPEALQEIRDELATYHSDLKALTDALTGLAAFIMLCMEKLNDPVAAEQIAELVKEQRVQYAPLAESLAGKFQTGIQGLAESATNALHRLTGTAQDKKAAPKFGEAGPPGSIPVATIPAAAPPPVSIKAKKPPAKKPKKR